MAPQCASAARTGLCAPAVAPKAPARPALGRLPAPALPQRAGARRAGTALRAGRSDGGVIDRPVTLPNVNIKKSSKGKKPPIYKVMLHNDAYNRREYVVKVLLRVVEGITPDDAVNAMQEAHVSGVAMVIAVAQEKAEKYCQGMRNNGLTASIEPESC